MPSSSHPSPTSKPLPNTAVGPKMLVAKPAAPFDQTACAATASPARPNGLFHRKAGDTAKPNLSPGWPHPSTKLFTATPAGQGLNGPWMALKYPPLASCSAADTPTKPHAWSRRRLKTGSKNSLPLKSVVTVLSPKVLLLAFTVERLRELLPSELSSSEKLADSPPPNCHVYAAPTMPLADVSALNRWAAKA